MVSAMMASMVSSTAALSTVSRKSGVQSMSSSVPALNNLKSGSAAFSAKLEWEEKTTTNGSRVHCMKVWSPINNTKFETLSYLPPLSQESLVKEIDYMISNGWIPCLEFDAVGQVRRTSGVMIPGYYDGRYWTLWKLPMFGCTNSAQVLSELEECKKAYPNAYIRCLGFDNKRQTQCIAFVVHKPSHPQ